MLGLDRKYAAAIMIWVTVLFTVIACGAFSMKVDKSSTDKKLMREARMKQTMLITAVIAVVVAGAGATYFAVVTDEQKAQATEYLAEKAHVMNQKMQNFGQNMNEKWDGFTSGIKNLKDSIVKTYTENKKAKEERKLARKQAEEEELNAWREQRAAKKQKGGPVAEDEEELLKQENEELPEWVDE